MSLVESIYLKLYQVDGFRSAYVAILQKLEKVNNLSKVKTKILKSVQNQVIDITTPIESIFCTQNKINEIIQKGNHLK